MLVNPTPPVPTIPTDTVAVEQPKYDSVVINSKHTSANTLLTHVEGSKWVVNYYSQILTPDAGLTGQQVTRDPLYQQYKMIERLIMRVTTPLNMSQDAVTKVFKTTGSAIIYSGIIPNEGDVFIADMGDGKPAAFRITLSERKTVFEDAVYAIEYILTNYYNDIWIGDLNAKVLDTFVYVEDFLKYGQNPVIIKSAYDKLAQLVEIYHRLVKRYFKTYLSRDYGTILLPGQQYTVYDHFLSNALMKIFTTDDTNDLRNVRLLNLTDDPIMRATTIWDALMERDPTMLKYCAKTIGLVSSKSFTINPMLEGIRFSGVQFAIYPKDPQLSVDQQIVYNQKPLDLTTLQNMPSPITDLSEVIPTITYNNVVYTAANMFPQLLVDDHYVLSAAFYNKDVNNQKLLEIVINQFLNYEPIDINVLLTLCQNAYSLSVLENFYFTPLLCMLIKDSVKSL